MTRGLLATLLVFTVAIEALLLVWFVMDRGLMLGRSERDIKLEACLAADTKDFDAVCRLADLGFYAAATEELQEVVANNPKSSVPKELKYLSGNEPFAWREAQYWIASRQGVLSLLVVFLVATWWVGLRTKRPRLDIQDFDDGATDLKIGKGLAAMAEESLQQFGEQGGVQSLDMIAEPVESATMPTRYQVGVDAFEDPFSADGQDPSSESGQAGRICTKSRGPRCWLDVSPRKLEREGRGKCHFMATGLRSDDGVVRGQQPNTLLPFGTTGSNLDLFPVTRSLG